jgi:probable HAF family extracellular repeat protein
LHVRRIELGGLIVSLCLATAAVAQPTYHLTDLGMLPGSSYTTPYAINNVGQVVGYSNVDGFDRAFLWQNGVMAPLDGTGALGVQSQALSINDSGLIAGEIGNIPTVWQGGTAIPLPQRPGDTYGCAIAVNASGQVVGTSGEIFGVKVSARWDGNGVTVLPGSGLSESRATGINSQGQACGWWLGGPTVPSCAFIWSNDTVTELPTLEGARSMQATELNDHGQVIGGALVGSSTFWPVLWDNDTVTRISAGPFPPASTMIPYGINEDGIVVGQGPRAWLWSAAWGTHMLGDLLDSSGAGWTLTEAYGINDLGQIVGSGRIGNEVHGFLVTPLPEPTTAAGLAAVLLLFGIRRRA